MTILWLVFAMIAHESGHYAAARLGGMNAAPRIRWGFISVGYWIGSGEIPYRLPTRREAAVIAAAGPLVNLALFSTAVRFGWYDAIPANMLLGLANLIPLPGTDGRAILRGLRSWRATV